MYKTTFVRMSLLERFQPRKFWSHGHKTESVDCPACDKPIEIDEECTLIPLGPGDDPETRSKAAQGSWFNAVAMVVHWECARGGTPQGSQ